MQHMHSAAPFSFQSQIHPYHSYPSKYSGLNLTSMRTGTLYWNGTLNTPSSEGYNCTSNIVWDVDSAVSVSALLPTTSVHTDSFRHPPSTKDQ